MQNSDARIIIYVDVYFLTIILDGKILRAKLDKNGLTSKNLCLAKDKAETVQEELDVHDTA